MKRIPFKLKIKVQQVQLRRVVAISPLLRSLLAVYFKMCMDVSLRTSDIYIHRISTRKRKDNLLYETYGETTINRSKSAYTHVYVMMCISVSLCIFDTHASYKMLNQKMNIDYTIMTQNSCNNIFLECLTR